ncbi:ankyrin-3 isoform X2 [Tanacetum coccineum]
MPSYVPIVKEPVMKFKLQCGADPEIPSKTSKGLVSRDKFIWLHGETALMICARHKHVECLKLLARSGADFGLVNLVNKCVQSIAGSVKWTLGLRQVILDVVRSGKVVYSTDTSIFSCLMFVTRVNDIEGLKILVDQTGLVDLDEQDENGYSAVMVAVINGYVEAFRLLVYTGANVNLRNKYGETAISLSEASVNSGEFEKVMLEYTLNSCNHGFYTLHHAVSRGDFESVERLTNGEKDVLLDHFARGVVLSGARVKKHCKGGKGCPHRKTLVMVEGSGLLRWGKSSRRNVVCKRAELGPSSVFKWNRQKKGDADEPGLFRVVTTRNKEVHFVCEGGVEMAELWVRGIKLVTQEAIFGK